MRGTKARVTCKGDNLGDYEIPSLQFTDLDETFKEFDTQKFLELSERDRSYRINDRLLNLIREELSHTFLLIPIIDFIERVKQKKLLEHYSFSHFELWLNQFSGLSPEENYIIRGRIVGKNIPREAYQVIFPIGMNKTYPGSHFVSAHHSPDIDTTIASFWGWVDAFGARVSEGMHIWNVPGGPPESQIEIPLLFNRIFGEKVFDHVAKTRVSLSLSSLDLLSQKGVLKKKTTESFFSIDHQRNQNSIILVDDNGKYLGDWLNIDIEGVRQVINLLNNCLRWFANTVQVQLISLFGQEEITASDLPKFIQAFFGMKIEDSDPVKEFTEQQREQLDGYIVKVFHAPNGLKSTFEEFTHAMKALSIEGFDAFITLVESLQTSALFDSKGRLQEDRPTLFKHLERVIKALNAAILGVRHYVDSLAVGYDIKTEVFGYLPQMVSYRAEVDEIKQKMDGYPYLTVTFPDNDGGLIPMGVVHATELYKTTLGTVTLRDFSNREEMKIPSYLDVISVIDHHKIALSTDVPPVAYVADAQSSNVLVAEIAFKINDQYSTGGMTLEEIEAQIDEVHRDFATMSNKRILRRLLKRHLIAESKGGYNVDPVREFIEYLHYLHAIFDDTDLLSKLSSRDVVVIASLINRMKSLVMGREVEIIHFDDFPMDESFADRAAARILQNVDVYSLYRTIYRSKEEEVEKNIKLCASNQPSNFFADTKEQNGCCRVGQTKMFARNFVMFKENVHAVRARWVEQAIERHEERPEFDLHIHMVNTIPSAEDLYAGSKGKYEHKDEMWFWFSQSEEGIEHFKSFLNSFSSAPEVVAGQPDMEVFYYGDNADEIDSIFQESFLSVPRSQVKVSKKESLPIAVLKFKAGSLNSRKSMVSPYLPRLVK